MEFLSHPLQLCLSLVLILSALGVICAKKPVHSCLCFLLTLLTLAAIYLQLSASFIAIMQILVYAGAILVIFMFVMILFQDAHMQIAKYHAKSWPTLLIAAAASFIISLCLFAKTLGTRLSTSSTLDENFGSVQSLGKLLYLDFFFPFEALLLLFLIASIGALYIAKKDV